jgi:hypothetical protein
MSPITHPSNTRTLGAPADWPVDPLIPCNALGITDTQVGPSMPAMVSFWKPTEAEIVMLANGGVVRLWIVGSTHPVVMVDTGEPT